MKREILESRQESRLITRFFHNVHKFSKKNAYVFLDEQLQETDQLSYQQLMQKASDLAQALQSRFARDDKVALLFSPGLEFIVAFWGCLLAGIVAVPVYPPRNAKSSSWQNIKGILADADAVAVLTSERDQKLLKVLQEAFLDTEYPVLSLEQTYGAENAFQYQSIDESAIAFLQYTSGSTGKPKGVMVSHQNLYHNESLIAQRFEHNSDTVVVGWLPVYHDMGLIGNILQPPFCGGTSIIMSPLTFLRKPINWLVAVSKYRATTSGGPDFAYQLCCESLQLNPDVELDLSHWTVAFNGAERVRNTTLERFSRMFEPFGFAQQSLHPCYGLAESTLMVTAKDKQCEVPVFKADISALRANEVKPADYQSGQKYAIFVSSGKVDIENSVQIVDPDSKRPCLPNQVGEIWVSGKSNAQGYWRNEALSNDIFCANLNGTPEPKYLRTGDLGFVKDDNLYITGRLKDLIIIRGLNHAPEDIEESVHAIDPEHFESSGSAAFSIEVNSQEELVIVQEVRRSKVRSINVDESVDLIKQSVMAYHGIAVHDVLLVRPGTLPKTTSGKIKRRQTQTLYLDGDINAIAANKKSNTEFVPDINDSSATQQTEDDNPHLKLLKAAITAVKPELTDSLGKKHTLSELGFDSLSISQLHNQLQKMLQVDIDLQLLFEYVPLAELAGKLGSCRSHIELEADQQTDLNAAPVVTAGEPFELAPNQQPLLFMSRRFPDIPIYNLCSGVTVNEHLCPDRVAKALFQLLSHFPVLTGHLIESGDDLLVQEKHVAEMSDIEGFWLTKDASYLDEEQQKMLLKELCDHKFDLYHGPLMQFNVIKLAEEESLILLVIHHLISDMGTILRLYKVFFRLYAGEAPGVLPQSFGHFSHLQKQWLSSAEADKAKAYWQSELQGQLPILNLPVDYNRTKNRSFAASTFRFQLDTELTESLQKISVEASASLFCVMLSAWQILLTRLSNQNQVVVGSPVSARAYREFSDLMGYSLNPTLFKADVNEDSQFSALVQRNQARLVNAIRFQRYPLQTVLQDIETQYPQNISPYIQTLFYLYENTEILGADGFLAGNNNATTNLSGMQIQSYKFDTRFVEYDVNLWWVKSAEGLLGEVTYNKDLFRLETVQNWMQCLTNLLQQLVKSPDAKISQLQLLNGELQQLVVDNWSCRNTQYAITDNLCQRFEEQVRKTPDNIAVQFNKQQLSYQSLHEQSNQLANYLLNKGVTPGTRIGILMPKCSELLVSIVAIIKCGSVYIPLDPAFPQKHREMVISDAGIKLVITDDEFLADNLGNSVNCLVLAEDAPLYVKESTSNPDVTIQSDDCAYVIYTSGSTGTPNGVMVSHKNVLRLMRACEKHYDFNDKDVWTMFHSFAFDFSVWEIWGALLNGGKLLVVPHWLTRNAESFYQYLVEQNVTVLNQTPSAFRQLMSHRKSLEGAQALISLRYVIFGGESLDHNTICEWFSLPESGLAVMCNMYGITETTVHSTFHQVTRAQVNEGPKNIIGRPLSDVDIYILDDNRHPVPAGVTGEIYIGGDALAIGYLNRPELNQQRFISHRVSSVGIQRLYKTGDLAKHLNDGTIQYLGRRDHQVKLRGFRIELGEIEFKLSQRREIKQVAVLITSNATCPESHNYAEQIKVLTAFVEPIFKLEEDEKQLFQNNIKNALNKELPEHMIPTRWIIMDELPVTSSGKINSKALLTYVEQKVSEQQKQSVAVRPANNQVEQELILIWQDLLGIDRVEVNHNFFELGGDSVQCNKLLIEAKKRGILFTLHDIFQCQTIEKIAEVALCEQLPESDIEAPGNLIKTRHVDDLYPLSFAQKRLWFMSIVDGNSARYNIQGVLNISGNFDVELAEKSFKHLVVKHVPLRSRIVEDENGDIFQQIGDAESFRISRVDLSSLSASQQQQRLQQLITEDSNLGFDLTKDLLLRVTSIRLSESSSKLVINMHHIAADGASIQVAAKEFSKIYQALKADVEIDSPEVNWAYLDYVKEQSEFLSGGELERLSEFWVDKLQGAPHHHSLHSNASNQGAVQGVGAYYKRQLSPQLTSDVKALCQEQRVTLFMMLQAAFAVHLGRWSQTSDVLMGAPNEGREQPGYQELIGLFINTVVYRTEFSDNPTFRELLDRTKDLHLQQSDYSHMPFESLVERINPERKQNRAPLFQVLINVNTTKSLKFNIPDAQMQLEDVGTNLPNKYDITLYIEEFQRGENRQIQLLWVYDKNRFSKGFFNSFADNFVDLVEQVTRQPEFKVLDYSYGSNGSQSSFVNPQLPYKSVMDLFEAQVSSNPGKIALYSPDGQFSFEQLNFKANQLAQYLLQQYHPVSGTRVAVATQRNSDRVVSILAILKCGLTFVPLSNEIPEERLNFILSSSGAKFILRDNFAQSWLGDSTTKNEVIDLCIDSPELKAEIAVCSGDFQFHPELSDTSVSHIIYTSGSTGLPKGVLGSFKNLVNRILWMQRAFPVAQGEELAHITSMSFIRGVWELFMPLCSGVPMHLIERNLVRQPVDLIATLNEKRVTRLVTAPSFLRSLLSQTEELSSLAMASHLKIWFISGEALDYGLVNKVAKIFPNVAFVNLYGSTEVASDVLFHEIDTSDDSLSVPLGKPIDNTFISICDKNGDYLPDGAIGEIYVSGANNACGYLGDAGKNNDRFIGVPGDNIYRTGDLGVRDENGNIVFKGRIDNQIKIRGVRIELGEIEFRLKQTGLFKDICVVLSQHIQDKLVAYFTRLDSANVNVADEQLKGHVRRELLAYLPSYMLPTDYIQLQQMPLLPNGKINRQSLTLQEGKLLSTSIALPESELEKQLAKTWAEVLNIDETRIGKSSSFFELGGHSLLVVKVLQTIRKNYQIELTYADFFEGENLSSLAEKVDSLKALRAVIINAYGHNEIVI